MTGWKAKRFWKQATVETCEGGFTIRLDGRPVRTPGKSLLVVPTRALALGIAAEWDAQQGEIRPATMPLTRYANSAQEKVRPQFDEVAGIVAAYGASDLLCYRAPAPEPLIARQAAGWDPVLAWAAVRFAAPLVVTSGVTPVDQPAGAIAALSAHVATLDAFRLTALHDLVAISGSLVLGLAVLERHLTAEEAFALSRIDEDFQAEIWGRDDEAMEIRSRKADDMSIAARFLQALA